MKKTYLILVSLFLALSLILTGCNSKETVSDPKKEPTSSQPPSDLMEGITSKNIQPNAEKLSQNALTDFSVNLFKASAVDGKNVLVSPLSVAYALAMTANGAKGDTLNQMETVLGIPIDELNDYLFNYQAILPQDEKYKFNLANSIWVASDRGFIPNKDFLQTNKDYYNADIYTAEFNDETLKNINDWVNNKTDGMIPSVLDRISEGAIMYLINALAFEAEWADPYDEGQVREGEFTLQDGTTQTVDFMYSSEYSYLENESSKGFIKYFKDNKYAFAALLPDEDITLYDYVQSLDGEEMASLLSAPVKVKVNASIPVFETDYNIVMNDVLISMGMEKPFDAIKADLSNMGTCEAGNIFISRVIHKTAFEIGPLGAKAGAATVVEIECGSSEVVGEIKDVHLNRPFVYMLIDCETNTPFFIGTVNNI